VNVATVCNNAVDFATVLGISNAKKTNGSWVYPACEIYDAMFIENNASPLVVINPHDPWTMSTSG
jgi:hypothetical protein